MLNEDGGIRIRDAEAQSSTNPSTLPELLLESARRHRKPEAFKFKKNGQWINVSTDEFLLRVEELALSLLALGVKPGDRIAILSENRIDWAVTDYAGLSVGARIVPIYPTLSPQQIEALLRDSEPVAIFVSNAELFRKVWSVDRPLPLRSIVCFDNMPHSAGDARVLSINGLYDIGRQCSRDYPGEFYRNVCQVDAEDIATIIYTSGTTGVPKGVMLTHRNLVSNILASSEVLPLTSTDIGLSFLPLSHIFQRHVDYASMYAGATIAYSGDVASAPQDMAMVRPTFAAGVPRFFEKVYARIAGEVARSSPIKRAIFVGAVRMGRNHLVTGK